MMTTYKKILIALGVVVAIIWALSFFAAEKPYIPPQGSFTPAEDTGDVPIKKLSKAKIGIEVIPQDYVSTQEKWADGFARAKSAGAQVVTLLNPAIHEWRDSEVVFATLQEKGYDFEMAYDIGGAIWHSRDEMTTPGLTFTTYSDPAFKKWYLDHFSSFLSAYGNKVTYVTIHVEGADSYFATYPQELEDYCQVIAEAIQRAKQQHPRLKVGVYAGHHFDKKLLLCLNRHTDFWAIGIYGGDPESFQKPSDIEDIFAKHVQWAGSKKIAIQEGAWSTSRLAGHSEQQQVEFIREMFRMLKKYRENIEYMSFYTIYDETRSITSANINTNFPSYPASFREKMIDDISSMGFIKEDGTPKPGWYELKKHIKEYYQSL